MNEEPVGRIHRRFYLTLISPESHITSLLISFFCASLIVILSRVYYLNVQISDLILILPLSLGALYLGKVIDLAVLKKLPMARLKKIYHTAAFANLLWVITVLMGMFAAFVFSKTTLHSDYIVAGLFLAMGLRIGIFTSVFGASLPRAMVLSPILPLAFFLAFVPLGSVSYYLSDPFGLGFGLTFVAIASIWSVMADRAGRPDIESTFKILQAYLLAWTDKNPRSMELIMEDRAQESTVSTYAISFKTPNGKSALVVPDVHPGPFHPVGGSNLPYEIYKAYSTNAMEAVIMHSISDHSLNLPSKRQVERYLRSLSNGSVLDIANTCTEPLVIQVNRARVSGIAFGSVSVLLLSLSPHGMEDVPELIRREVETYAEQKGFDLALVIDSHNSIGKHLSEDDSADMLKACKIALDELKMKPQFNFECGFCHSSETGASASDVGPAGMSVIAIKVNGKLFGIGWADGNNMVKNLRENILQDLSLHGVSMLEVCTSDTHFTSGRARNLTGYFTFGSLSSFDAVGKWYLDMAKRAIERIAAATYEVSHTTSNVKVMGAEQFSDYSTALDRALNITKVSLGITVATYIAMLVIG
jgi:putative membrane protein